MIFFHVNLRVCMWFIKLNMKCCLVQHSLHKFDHHAYLGILLCCLVTVVRRRTGRACLVSWTSCWQGCLFRNEMDPFYYMFCRQEWISSYLWTKICIRFFCLLCQKVNFSSLTDIYVILSTGYQNSQRFAASSKHPRLIHTLLVAEILELLKGIHQLSGTTGVPRVDKTHKTYHDLRWFFSDEWSLECKYIKWIMIDALQLKMS